MVVHSDQSEGGPGELQGLEVHRGPARPLSLDGGIVSTALGGRGGAVEHPDGVEREPVQDLDAAVVEGQSEA